jgi:hypothetical protein
VRYFKEKSRATSSAGVPNEPCVVVRAHNPKVVRSNLSPRNHLKIPWAEPGRPSYFPNTPTLLAYARVLHLICRLQSQTRTNQAPRRVSGVHSETLLEVPPRQPNLEFGPEGPYDSYTGVFPACHVALQPLSETEQRELEARQVADVEDNVDSYFGHQVGGYPFTDNPWKAFCPICSKEMPSLAGICDNATGNQDFSDEPNKSFTGNSRVQMVFQFCRDCSVVTAYHSCD